MTDDRERPVDGQPEPDARDDQLDPDGGRPDGQATIGTDPWLEDFNRSPYDPLFAAQAAGRLTGETIQRTSRTGCLRLIAIVIAVLFIGTTLIGLVSLARPVFAP